MRSRGYIEITAGLLQEALAVAVPDRRRNSRRKKKAWPLTLEHRPEESILDIAEARHALRGYDLTAVGHWPEQVQVDGHVLRRMVETYDPAAVIKLIVLEDEFCVLYEGSQIRLKRIDAGGKPGIKRRPIPRDPKHMGPIEVPPDPVGKRVELDDTWAFSARVPMPQHRPPKDK